MARTFAAVLIGESEDLLACWRAMPGYGFAVKLSELYGAQQGKARSVLKVAGECQGIAGRSRSRALPRSAVFVNNDGEVLALPAAQIEEMSAGKGQNLYGIPGEEVGGSRRISGGHGGDRPGRDADGVQRQQRTDEAKIRGAEKPFQDKKGQRRQRFSRAYKQVDRLEVAPPQP